ncbi:MAG: 50S ribosomal protein L5 [Gemmatimonadales bacterium]
MSDEETKVAAPEAPKAEGHQAKPEGGKPKGEKQPKGEKKGKGEAPKADSPKAPAVPAEPPPPARLHLHYEKHVRAALAKEFGFKNAHQVPRITKIVLNVGFGEGGKQSKALDVIVNELGLITGQKAVMTRAKKAIANFNLRQGLAIGASVTLRGARMYEFLDRFISVAVPRIRDFRGLPAKSFDGRGNYTFGIKEQMIFPEIDYDKVERIHGMDITIVTNAGKNDVAKALLREMGMPFAGEQPVLVA